MTLIDLLILGVLTGSVIAAFVKGFFVEVFSLAGVVVGLFVAAANYAIFTPWIERVVSSHEIANLIAFVVIALLVMVVAGILGRLFRRLLRGVGLGIVDRLLGAAFGFVRGVVVVTLVLMAVLAFLPRQAWLDRSRLAPVFLSAAQGGSHVVPLSLGEKIRQGLDQLRWAQPGWSNRGSQISP